MEFSPTAIEGLYDDPADTEECERCKNRGGYCSSNKEYYIDDTVYKDNPICYEENENKTSSGVILGNVFSLCL